MNLQSHRLLKIATSATAHRGLSLHTSHYRPYTQRLLCYTQPALMPALSYKRYRR